MVLGPGQFTSLPYEVKFDAATAKFYIDKCYNDPLNPQILPDGECKDGSIPYEFSRDIAIIAVLEDGTGQVASTALNFRVTILDACLYDTITFDQTINVIDYAVSTSGQPFTPQGAPIYSHTYPLCPVSCYLSAEGGASISQAVVDGLGLSLVETPQPELTIQTSDKYWVGYSGRFDIACRSTNSDTDVTTPGNQNSITVDTFTINVVDECSQTLIQPAGIGSYNTLIYSSLSMPFTLGSTNLDCGAPIYELSLLSSTSPDPTNCVINDSTKMIEMLPDERDDAGIYSIKLDTCVTYLVDGQAGIYDKKCANDGPFTVTIADPCENTSILATGWTYMMSQPQLQTETLDFAQ